MEQLGSYRKDFHEILYFRNFRKSTEKIQVSLKSGRIKDTLHENQYTFYYLVSQISSENEKYFRQTL